MKKLLVICGPTATGKTSLAMSLAKKFNGELVSADSRQVYKYMDIGTGKDRPKDITIWGYDLVRPDQDFSVSQYANFARHKIAEIYAKNELPILVGGTGLYIKAVVDGIGTVNIPRNKKLRNTLESFSVSSLQEKLRSLDVKKFNSLNASDVNNPRRLIRAIEIALSGQKTRKTNTNYDVLFIGLGLSKEKLAERIKKRVDERVKQGFAKEVEFLKQKDFFRYMPSATLGYKDWPDIAKWKTEEFKYAKRQLTWFKKEARINWFDVSKNDYAQKIDKLVERWHNKQ